MHACEDASSGFAPEGAPSPWSHASTPALTPLSTRTARRARRPQPGSLRVGLALHLRQHAAHECHQRVQGVKAPHLVRAQMLDPAGPRRSALGQARNCTTKARLLGSVGWDGDMSTVHPPGGGCVGRLRDLSVPGRESTIAGPFTNRVRVFTCRAVTTLPCSRGVHMWGGDRPAVFTVVHGSHARRSHGAGARAHVCGLPAGAAAGRLMPGRTMIALRPRSLAVLRYLVAHAGRLVTKAELRQHVWGGAHVSDTVLRVCVGRFAPRWVTRRRCRSISRRSPRTGISFGRRARQQSRPPGHPVPSSGASQPSRAVSGRCPGPGSPRPAAALASAECRAGAGTPRRGCSAGRPEPRVAEPGLAAREGARGVCGCVAGLLAAAAGGLRSGACRCCSSRHGARGPLPGSTVAQRFAK